MGNLPLNIDVQQILLHLFNFTILFAVLYFVLYKPVRDFMNKRADYYKSMDENAKSNLAASEEAKAMYEEKLAKVDSEISEKKEAAGKANITEREQIIKRAEDDAAKIVADARKNAKEEHDKIISDAQKEIAEIVDEATKKIVMDSDIDSYDQFLNSVNAK